MSAEKIANRYAAALLSMTQGQASAQDSLAAALSEIASLYENKEIKKILASPIVSPQLLRDVFAYAEQRLQSEAVLGKFLNLLVESRRTSLIPAIARAFRQRLQQQSGVVDAVLTTAVALDAVEEDAIRVRLEEMLAKKVQLQTRIDKTILGGFVVRVENSLLDLSLKTKLDNMTKMAVS